MLQRMGAGATPRKSEKLVLMGVIAKSHLRAKTTRDPLPSLRCIYLSQWHQPSVIRGGLTREPHDGAGGGLVALWFVLNMISQQEPGQRRSTDLSRQGFQVKHGGHAWEHSQRRGPPQKNAALHYYYFFFLDKMGFALHPEGFAPGKNCVSGQ